MTTSICELRRWGLAFAEYCCFQKKMADEGLKGSSLDCWVVSVSVLRTIPHIARRIVGRHAHFHLTFAMLPSHIQFCLFCVSSRERSALCRQATHCTSRA